MQSNFPTPNSMRTVAAHLIVQCSVWYDNGWTAREQFMSSFPNHPILVFFLSFIEAQRMCPVVGRRFRPSQGPTRILLSHASNFVWLYLPTNPQLYWTFVESKWKLWFSSSNEISFDLEMLVIVYKCKFRWCEVNGRKTDLPTWGRRSWLWDRLRLPRGRMRRQFPRWLRGPIREHSACKWWDVRYEGLPFLGQFLGW